jgi:hypothetical protein
LIGTVEVDFPVVKLRSAGAFFARTGVEITEICVRAEPGDEVSVHFSDGTENLPFRIKPVSNPVGDAHLGKSAV